MDKEQKAFQIAIDGPAGAGKSTIAKKVAAKLGFIYVDTGAMYRAMALYFADHGVKAETAGKNPDLFKSQIETLADKPDVTLAYRDGAQVALLDQKDVTGQLRTEVVSQMASKSSAIPKVRTKLTQTQRILARTHSVVMDGRDIGTVVLPDAQVKVYLTASVEERARRRYLENVEAKKRGVPKTEEDLNLELIKKDIAARDDQDMHREVAPLKRAEDAVLIDSSDMTIDEVVDAILDLVKKAGYVPEGK